MPKRRTSKSATGRIVVVDAGGELWLLLSPSRAPTSLLPPSSPSPLKPPAASGSAATGVVRTITSLVESSGLVPAAEVVDDDDGDVGDDA